MDKTARDFFCCLLRAHSPSGDESAHQRIWLDYVKTFAQVETDHSGNAIGALNAAAPFKVLLAGHSDEIAMLVKRVDERGFIYFTSAGGIKPALLPGLKVDILGYNGKVGGVIGFNRKSDTDAPSKPKCEDYFIDCGFSSKKEVEKFVRVGDYILYQSEPELFNKDKLVCKGLDNKTGSFIVAETLRKLSRQKLKVGVFAVSTTGEETNMRGAHCAGAVIQPNMGIACDVTYNTDTPGEDAQNPSEILLGKGPALSVGSPINRRINELLEKSAKKLKMPLQFELTPGRTCTDADRIMFSGNGVPVALVSLPLRYMHSPIEMASIKDIDAVIELLSATIASLTGKEDLRPLKP
ncbi:MAG TPA: endoglucanase [Candidatus Riflebacteria bacterium]|jgi:endoglucanase|nr:endoglucanase [Candidatus Riflebacteria bacterium]